MRIFTATLGTESNSFSPIPTGMAGFEDCMLWRPGEHPDFPTEATGPLWVSRKRAGSVGWDVVEGTCAFAMPAGPVSRSVYESLRNELLEQVAAAMPVDIIALGMHGAMIAHGYPDCEGDLLKRIRQLVGEEVALGAELDCHAHLTEDMTRYADVLVLFKEYPHTDYLERAEELVDLLEACAKKRCHPTMSVFDCRMIQGFRTLDEPAKQLVVRMQEMEDLDRVLSVSLVHGFGLGDVYDVGTKVCVVTDNDEALGNRLAAELGTEIYRSFRTELKASESIREIISGALRSEVSPVLLADTADNAGGGQPGDRTQIIQSLIDMQVENACLGPIWDPIAVRFCHEAGEGATLSLRFGGKASVLSGTPIDAEVTVIGLRREASQEFQGSRIPIGDTAGIRFQGIEVVLSSLRDQAYSPNLFTDVGIDPAGRKLVIVKGSQQFSVGFECFGQDTRYIRYGATTKDRGYQNIRRPMWPLDKDPLKLDQTEEPVIQ